MPSPRQPSKRIHFLPPDYPPWYFSVPVTTNRTHLKTLRLSLKQTTPTLRNLAISQSISQSVTIYQPTTQLNNPRWCFPIHCFNVHPYLKTMIRFDSYFSGSNHQLENPDSQNQQFRLLCRLPLVRGSLGSLQRNELWCFRKSYPLGAVSLSSWSSWMWRGWHNVKSGESGGATWKVGSYANGKSFSGWWQLKDFWNFHPENWGRWTHFDSYFSKGLVQPPTSFQCTWFAFFVCFQESHYAKVSWG